MPASFEPRSRSRLAHAREMRPDGLLHETKAIRAMTGSSQTVTVAVTVLRPRHRGNSAAPGRRQKALLAASDPEGTDASLVITSFRTAMIDLRHKH
jgi:hypothetical protein